MLIGLIGLIWLQWETAWLAALLLLLLGRAICYFLQTCMPALPHRLSFTVQHPVTVSCMLSYASGCLKFTVSSSICTLLKGPA